MIGTQITIKNHNNGKQVILNDHSDVNNVIALQSFPTFETEERANSRSRQGAHGEFKLPYYYSGMSIVLQGIIVGQDEAHVWAIKKTFDEVMSLPYRFNKDDYNSTADFPPFYGSTVRLSFTNPNGKKCFVDCSPIKVVSYDRPLQQKYLLDFQVILRSPFPYLVIEDDTPNIKTGTLGKNAKGFVLPTKLPLSLGTQILTGEVTITVDTPSMAIVKMKGSANGVLVNPRITNVTNGSYVVINKTLDGADSFFEINGVYETMKDQSGKFIEQYAEGEFIYLDIGNNNLVYTADKIIPN